MRRLLFSSIVCGTALVSACQDGENDVDPDEGNLNNGNNQNQNAESNMNNNNTTDNDTENDNGENENHQNDNASADANEEEWTFTEENAIDLLHKHEETLTAYFDEAMEQDQELSSVDGIEEVENTLLDFMSQEEADFHLETYFSEEDGSVTVVPTEAPVWFDDSMDYTFEHDEDTARITQERDNELIGHIIMLYDFKYADDEDQWQIESIDSEELNNENG